ncbi:M14 family zinc carboxypeptidase [Bacteroidota bacterium]
MKQNIKLQPMIINTLKERLSAILAAGLIVLTGTLNAQQKPVDYFGFEPGSDRNLFNYEELIGYLQKLDAAADKLKMVEIGKSPEGRTMYIAFLSSAENIARLDELKEINRRLALEANIPAGEKEKLIDAGKVFILGTLSMHSGEVGPAQAAPLIAYDLVTTEDEDKLGWMEDVVYMMVPNHNPDGMNKIVNNYLKYKGTKYEGASLPEVYHKYVGHDNNRDFVTLTQTDTKAIAAIYNLEWFPQVMIEKHQMGSTGTRYFVPPNHDPIAVNIDATMWTWTGVFGSNMLKDMTRDSLYGVSTHYLFDEYWPGATETCLWKNVIGMLTEAASVKTATPVYVEPNEIGVSGKGLAEHKKSINLPHPWEGGWWRLSDIIEYEKSSTYSLLKTGSKHREDILAFRNDLAVGEVNKGKTQAPYYYIMPASQHDPSELVKLVNLLKEHGVKVYETGEEMRIGNKLVEKGSIVVPLAQPFRAFIKEVLEVQEYPVRHYTTGGPVIRPYDIASWSLPLHMGVKSWEVNKRFAELESSIKEIKGDYSLRTNSGSGPVAILPARMNDSYKAAFMGLEIGLKVARLTEDAEVNGEKIEKGSFALSVGKKSVSLEQVLSDLDVDPVYANEVPAGAKDIRMPRIALVETNFHDMDAGWTRYVLDTYHVPFTVVKPGDFEKTDFTANYDVVVFPSANKSILMDGNYGDTDSYYRMSMHPDYTKGIGKKGKENLMSFVDKGGVIVSWGQSTELFQGKLSIKREKETEDFGLPFSDMSKQLSGSGLYCPGSLVRINLKQDHPTTYGMPSSVGVFYRGRPVFQTSVPGFDMDRRTIGVTPEKDILVSGYIEKEELLKNRSLMIWMSKGEGQFVLFGFNPNFRASTHATYKLLFNSLLL